MGSMPLELPEMTVDHFKRAAATYAAQLSVTPLPSLFGVTDGKRLGTFVEAGFKDYLLERHAAAVGSAARGIDFPSLNVDLKVTSIAQPQSSCPFRDATQKIYGLGYHLLVLVYEKRDVADERAAYLTFRNVIFIEAAQTADFTITRLLRHIVLTDDRLIGGSVEAKVEEVDAVLQDKNIPLDDVSRRVLADRIVEDPPEQGCLTISNALQWRLQYARAIGIAASGSIQGVEDLSA